MAKNSQYDENSTYVGLGQVAPRPIIRRNLDVLGNALNKIDERSDRAIEKKSSIDAALSQIKLNSKEDEWKYNYIKGLKDKIDKAAKYGDYSRALDVATETANQAINSPELIGRMRANETYETKKKEVEARNDINEITKKRWLAQNIYTYEDIKDSDGNIVGGTDWTAKWNPVKQIDPVQLAALAGQFTSEERKGTSTRSSVSNTFSDENGIKDANGNIKTGSTETISNGLEANNGGITKSVTSILQSTSSSKSSGSSSSYARKSFDRLKNTFDALWKINPDAMLSLSQEYDDMQWQIDEYKKLIATASSPVERGRYEEQLESMNKAFLGRNGQKLSQNEWIYNKIEPLLKAQAYNNTETSTESSVSNGNQFGWPTGKKLKSGNDSSNNQSERGGGRVESGPGMSTNN